MSRVELFGGFATLAAPIKKALRGVVVATAENVQTDAVNRIQSGPKTGKSYRRGAFKRYVKTGGKRAGLLAGMGLKGTENAATGKTAFITGYGFHRASAPGESPASDTANLAGSIGVAVTGALEAEVQVGAEYGETLETGSPNGKIAARPYMRPAVDAQTEGFEKAIGAAVQMAVSAAQVNA